METGWQFAMNGLESVYNAETKGKRSRANIPTSQRKSLTVDQFINKKLLKEKCEVITVNLMAPLTKEQYKSLSDDTRKIYIKHLRTTYNAPNHEIAKAVGYNPKPFQKEIDRLGLKEGKGRHHQMTEEQKVVWYGFLYGKKEDDEVVDAVEEEEEVEMKIESKNIAMDEDDIEVIPFEMPRMISLGPTSNVLSDATFAVRGVIDPMDISNKITALINERDEYLVEVCIKKVASK